MRQTPKPPTEFSGHQKQPGSVPVCFRGSRYFHNLPLGHMEHGGNGVCKTRASSPQIPAPKQTTTVTHGSTGQVSKKQPQGEGLSSHLSCHPCQCPGRYHEPNVNYQYKHLRLKELESPQSHVFFVMSVFFRSLHDPKKHYGNMKLTYIHGWFLWDQISIGQFSMQSHESYENGCGRHLSNQRWSLWRLSQVTNLLKG